MPVSILSGKKSGCNWFQLHPLKMVAEAGLEPATSGLWARRAANCSTPRYSEEPDGAGDRTRTGTVSLPGDFKSPVSAIPPHRRISATLNIPHPRPGVNTFSRKHQKLWSAPAKYAVCLILPDKSMLYPTEFAEKIVVSYVKMLYNV